MGVELGSEETENDTGCFTTVDYRMTRCVPTLLTIDQGGTLAALQNAFVRLKEQQPSVGGGEGVSV